MENATPQLRRTLGLRDLVLLNVASILGMRWLSTAAQMGPSSLVLWLGAMVVFFVPLGLTVMELSSRLPGEGGLYLWSKEAFGSVHGFITGWSYWVNNLFYFPTLLLFISGSLLFLGGPEWVAQKENPLYNAGFSLAVLWLIVGLNILGLERAKWIQNLGAVAKVVTPVGLIVLGAFVLQRFGSATEFTAKSMMPDVSQFSSLTFFATMTFAFSGLELGPVMGDEIREPRRTVPRALVISGLLISVLYMAGTAVLLLAIPAGEVSVVTGIPQAVATIGSKLGIAGLDRLGGLMLALASIGGLGAWMTGVARVPFVVGLDRYLPKALGKVHPRWGSPHVALLTQGVLVSLFLLAAVAGSTVEEAYIVLLDMCIVLYFIPYLYMFLALPVLRKRSTENAGIALIPGGRAACWLVAGLGFATTMLSIVLALVPPAGSENPGLVFLKVGGGSALFIAVGLAFYFRARR